MNIFTHIKPGPPPGTTSVRGRMSSPTNRKIWLVKVPLEACYVAGNIIDVERQSGDTVSVQLLIEVPYRSTSIAAKKSTRWTFVAYGSDPTAHVSRVDGYPEWWSRWADTEQVIWPIAGDVWIDRDNGTRYLVETAAHRDPQHRVMVAHWQLRGNTGHDRVPSQAEALLLTGDEFMSKFRFDSRGRALAGSRAGSRAGARFPEVRSGRRPER